jgi:predicted ribosome quality control (RQC) complex YloA/Tae2 family protein
MRIPFDAVVLRAVLDELRTCIGAKVQRIVQPDEWTLVLELYGGHDTGTATLLLCCHPEFYRIHFVTLRYGGPPQPPTLCATLRARLDGSRLVGVTQVSGDRIAELTFDGDHRLIVELMGKHSNVMLVAPDGHVVAAAKWVGPKLSSRPIQSGQPYVLPPVLDTAGRLSPFATKLLASGGVVEGPTSPVLSSGNGAYPYSVATLGLSEVAKPSLSVALEQHYSWAVPASAAAALKATLSTNLDRVILAREVAIADLHNAQADSSRARSYQEQGELVLAFGQNLPPEASELVAIGYDGAEVTIPLDPEADFRQNAEFYFKKSKRAKGRVAFVAEQIDRLTTELDTVKSLRARVETAPGLEQLLELKTVAQSSRWLNEQRHIESQKDRPFGGHRIREVAGPGNARVLYGETAEANDYLTQRVAKPNDVWLHVRGNRSAHVVIPTANRPDRVGNELLHFAAGIAARNSAAKHSGLVAVDWTLKKYVRKPKGSAVGTVTYSMEKTLHVEGGA